MDSFIVVVAVVVVVVSLAKSPIAVSQVYDLSLKELNSRPSWVVLASEHPTAGVLYLEDHGT